MTDYGDGNLGPARDIQLSQLFERSPDLLALASFEPRQWVRANPAFETLLGWAEHELIGRPLLEIVHPADQDRLSDAAANLEEPSASDVEIRLLCKGGGCRWIAWRMAPDQQADSLLFIGRDVTQSRRTMKHLRTASVRMQRENESLEQFVRTAGHDLQEPLRTLSMYSDLLMRRYGSEMPGNSAELLSQIFGAATRMNALVRDLLVYAHISKEPEDSSNSFVTVSLQSIFEHVVESLKSSIEECGASITHEPLPEVSGDETQLSQLLQNLISNSLKYRSPEGSVKIHVGVERRGGEWQFEITDNGSGFEPQHAASIFLEFKRLHGREIPGTGLGLPICSRIVQRHGGRIWAEGRPGDGATFWFTLPTPAPAASL